MDYDKDKVDAYTLALLSLVSFDDGSCSRAWKSFEWETMDRLHEKSFISDPKSKAKSVVLTIEGKQKMQELFDAFFKQ